MESPLHTKEHPHRLTYTHSLVLHSFVKHLVHRHKRQHKPKDTDTREQVSHLLEPNLTRKFNLLRKAPACH